MSTLHLMRDFEHARERFKGTDPTAVIIFAVAAGLLLLLLASIF